MFVSDIVQELMLLQLYIHLGSDELSDSDMAMSYRDSDNSCLDEYEEKPNISCVTTSPLDTQNQDSASFVSTAKSLDSTTKHAACKYIIHFVVTVATNHYQPV